MEQKIKAELKEPYIPDECITIWFIFWDLFTGGETAIRHSDILAYSILHGYKFTEHELELLKLMDRTACSFVSKAIRADMKAKKGR